MKIVSELKGGSLSCTKIIERNGKSYVRKSVSTELNREYGLVRWQSQIRKQQILERILGDSVATICEVGVDGDAFYFDMPFMCGGVNCVAALVAVTILWRINRTEVCTGGHPKTSILFVGGVDRNPGAEKGVGKGGDVKSVLVKALSIATGGFGEEHGLHRHDVGAGESGNHIQNTWVEQVALP